MIESRGRKLDRALLCRLRVRRQNPAEQLTLERDDKPLLFEAVIAAFADQFRDVFFPEKILVEISNLGEHLQVGELLSITILLRLLRRAPRPGTVLPQSAIAR